MTLCAHGARAFLVAAALSLCARVPEHCPPGPGGECSPLTWCYAAPRLQTFEGRREEVRNKAIEEVNVLSAYLDAQIEELEHHFETAYVSYLQVRLGCRRTAFVRHCVCIHVFVRVLTESRQSLNDMYSGWLRQTLLCVVLCVCVCVCVLFVW